MTDINVGAISEALNNKADRDINNLTNSGYAKGSGLGMPSSRYIGLTLGASGSTYTAPANGYYYIDKNISSSGQYIIISNTSKGRYSVYQDNTNNAIRFLFPCCKGDIIQINYNASGNTTALRFYYAEGEQ